MLPSGGAPAAVWEPAFSSGLSPALLKPDECGSLTFSRAESDRVSRMYLANLSIPGVEASLAWSLSLFCRASKISL